MWQSLSRCFFARLSPVCLNKEANNSLRNIFYCVDPNRSKFPPRINILVIGNNFRTFNFHVTANFRPNTCACVCAKLLFSMRVPLKPPHFPLACLSKRKNCFPNFYFSRAAKVPRDENKLPFGARQKVSIVLIQELYCLYSSRERE